MLNEPTISPVVICPEPSPSGTKYKIAECIGSGGFSFVYRAIRQPDKKEFAIKVCPHEALENERFKAKHFAEIKIQSNLHHPNIVQLVQHWSDANNTYIVMELCKKGSVSKFLKSGWNLSESETALIMGQVVNAVKYCHEQEVIHRDLKLDNFLISECDNMVKITDFGISEDKKKHSKDVVFAGTPQYMGPEVLALKKYGYQVDIWAIGVCTYELLTGHRPFDACNMKDMYKKISKGEFQFPHELHLSFIAKNFIESALQVNPTMRPSINDLAKHPFLQQAKQCVEKRTLDADSLPVFSVTRHCESNGDFGFILTDGTCGALFDDSSCMIIDPFCEFVQFYRNIKDAKPIILQVNKIEKTQKQFKKLMKFRDSLTAKTKRIKLPDAHLDSSFPMPFVTMMKKNEKGKLFVFNNKILQVNFENKTKAFVDESNKVMVIFNKSKKGKKYTLDKTLSDNKEAKEIYENVKSFI